MKKLSLVLLGVSLAAAASFAAAQETAPMPKVIQITREFVKAGKAGQIHDRSESNFVQAMARAKWPTHYFALNSLSGKSRALYITGYSSFEAWQKDNDAVAKNAVLTSELERASVSDGDLLDAMDQLVFYYQEDLSYRPNPDLSHTRYIEAESFHLRPGHHKDWNDLVKLVIAGHQKAGTNANWAMYRLEYGGANSYVLFSTDNGMADIDQGFAEGKKFREAMGEDGMKQMEELARAAIESSDSELFSINPRQSYPPEEWVKADPAFWKPRPWMAPAAKAASSGTSPAAKAKPPQGPQ
jgi:hypothetical protein